MTQATRCSMMVVVALAAALLTPSQQAVASCEGCDIDSENGCFICLLGCIPGQPLSCATECETPDCNECDMGGEFDCVHHEDDLLSMSVGVDMSGLAELVEYHSAASIDPLQTLADHPREGVTTWAPSCSGDRVSIRFTSLEAELIRVQSNNLRI
ncbi:MAG: hypothetical protein WEE89_18655 [Gemmatimonadota bacterium]